MQSAQWTLIAQNKSKEKQHELIFDLSHSKYIAHVCANLIWLIQSAQNDFESCKVQCAQWISSARYQLESFKMHCAHNIGNSENMNHNCAEILNVRKNKCWIGKRAQNIVTFGNIKPKRTICEK